MRWSWISGKCRGTSHEANGSRLQDASVVFSPVQYPDLLVCVLSDGAGTAEFGGQGASLICRTIATKIRVHFAKSRDFPTECNLLDWIDETRDRIGAVAGARGKVPRDFSGTLVAGIFTGEKAQLMHVGDGSIVLRRSSDKLWIAPTWPENGEFASTTFFLTDDQGPKIRLHLLDETIDGVVLFTDGMERLALDFQAHQPFQPFCESMLSPLLGRSVPGYDKALSQRLLAFLKSPPVTSRTDDDKTLVIAALR